MHGRVTRRLLSMPELNSFPGVVPMQIVRSITLFVLAGVCEIGGGYLVWLWLRQGRSVWLGALGGLVLFLYGVLPTFQPLGAPFGRVYAAYGGVFVVLSLLWGWRIDAHPPDRADVAGALLCLAGVAVIMYWPRP
jgi:small multidrug resistance family-3 protein